MAFKTYEEIQWEGIVRYGAKHRKQSYDLRDTHDTLMRMGGGAVNRGELTAQQVASACGASVATVQNWQKREREWRAQIARKVAEKDGCGCPQ